MSSPWDDSLVLTLNPSLQSTNRPLQTWRHTGVDRMCFLVCLKVGHTSFAFSRTGNCTGCATWWVLRNRHFKHHLTEDMGKSGHMQKWFCPVAFLVASNEEQREWITKVQQGQAEVATSRKYVDGTHRLTWQAGVDKQSLLIVNLVVNLCQYIYL